MNTSLQVSGILKTSLQFIQGPDWRAHGFPDRKQKTDLSKWLLSTRKRPRILSRTPLLALGIDLNWDLLLFVFEVQLSRVTTKTKQVSKVGLGFDDNALPEPIELLFSHAIGITETLKSEWWFTEIPDVHLQCLAFLPSLAWIEHEFSYIPCWPRLQSSLPYRLVEI